MGENQSVIDNIFEMAPTIDNVELIVLVSPYYVPQKECINKINDYLQKNSDFFTEHPEWQQMLMEVLK